MYTPETRKLISARQPRYQVSLTLVHDTRIVPANTLIGASALCKAFEVEHYANRDAQTGIYDFGTLSYVHSWIGGRKFGLVDTRHPIERYMARAIRSGKQVTIIADGDAMMFNADLAHDAREAA